MKKLKFLPAIILAALAMSCGGDDDETFVTPQTFLINSQTETYNGNEMANREYEYDASNRIIQELNNTETIAYSWNGSGKIIKKTAFDGFGTRETIYTYDSDGKLIDEQTRNMATNTVANRGEYAYFSDHYQQKYYNSDGDLQWIYRNYYTEDKKNISISKRFFSTNELFDTYTYEYDDNKSIESVAPFSMLPTPFQNANNVIGVVGRDSNNVINYTSETSYTFNENGFPTSSTSGAAVKNYTYIVK